MNKITGSGDDIANKVLQEITADRIKQKRKQKRKRRMLRALQSILAVLLLLSLGITGYAIIGINAVKNKSHRQEARASEIRSDEREPIYNCFATVGSTSLELSLPGKMGDVVGVGFHEAERKEAIAMTPVAACLNKEPEAAVKDAVRHSKIPLLFTMSTRWRGSAPTSAADIAMVDKADVLSPVDGTVVTVKTYNLYGRITDYHIEIKPDGFPDIKVVIIHVDNVKVKVGQEVNRRKTIIGSMRALPQIKSQIIKYLPGVRDHVHIQINPATVKGELGS